MRITRLAEGVDASGELAPAALERTFAVLETYAEMMSDAGVGQRRLVATSAARDARNAVTFSTTAATITGADVEVLGGLEEASLSFAGATSDLDAVDLPTMIVDIGGGSTELAALIDGTLVAASMQIGCVRVTERALGPGIVTLDSEQRALEMIDAELARAVSRAPALDSLIGAVRLVGLAGTVATLAQLDAGLVAYDRAAVHHRHLTEATVSAWRLRLGAEEPSDRLTRPGMVRGREDVIVAGILILERVLEHFEVRELLSSECDILDGIVASLL
jgi:exopolyphosphatase / guanosine-5'-triphosphate,3'-diphosphate pyrophosphatase